MSLSVRFRIWLLLKLMPELPTMIDQCFIDGDIPQWAQGTVAHEYVKLGLNVASLLGLVEGTA